MHPFFKYLLAAALSGIASKIVLAGPIQPMLDQLVKAEKLPGAVLLVSGPKGRQIAVAGVANRKTREQMTEQTRFYIASSCKLVTAAAAMQLVQEGRVKLSDPVYPWFSGVAGIDKLRNIKTVTIDQLLAHRSGMAEYYNDDFESDAAKMPDKRWGVAESLSYAFGIKAQSKPGQEFNYTNTNYVLLGGLLEQVDGTTYAKSVQRRIFDPIGMPKTTIGATKVPSGIAHGYSRNDGDKIVDVSYAGWNAITGDGAVVTTVSDYEAFLKAMFRDAKLLPVKTVARMCRPATNDPASDYGLGCAIEDTRWGVAWGHNGSISGFNSVTWYIPKIDVTLVFFTNGDLNSEGSNVMEKAVKAYLKE
jgi:D-alanyl-D-alanine carboxypeptidase